jgi:hypothetical protein
MPSTSPRWVSIRSPAEICQPQLGSRFNGHKPGFGGAGGGGEVDGWGWGGGGDHDNVIYKAEADHRDPGQQSDLHKLLPGHRPRHLLSPAGRSAGLQPGFELRQLQKTAVLPVRQSEFRCLQDGRTERQFCPAKGPLTQIAPFFTEAPSSAMGNTHRTLPRALSLML